MWSSSLGNGPRTGNLERCWSTPFHCFTHYSDDFLATCSQNILWFVRVSSFWVVPTCLLAFSLHVIFSHVLELLCFSCIKRYMLYFAFKILPNVSCTNCRSWIKCWNFCRMKSSTDLWGIVLKQVGVLCSVSPGERTKCSEQWNVD